MFEYDVNKLIALAYDALNCEAEEKKYFIKIRKRMGLPMDASLWIPSLDGSTAHRLGELCERSEKSIQILRDICDMINVDADLLFAAVKSMCRYEKYHWKQNRDFYPATVGISQETGVRFARSIYKEDETGKPFYERKNRYKSIYREKKYIG